MSDKKVAIITAGGSGMGAAAARKLAADGFNVSILSSSGKGEALANELGGIGVTGSNQSNDDLQRLVDATVEKWSRVDVLVMPTSSIPASLIPAKAGINSKQEVLEGYAGRRSFTAPFNLANVPAMSINCGFTTENLPVGLQLAGKPFAEETLFRVAHAYEQATDWHNRRTPV